MRPGAPILVAALAALLLAGCAQSSGKGSGTAQECTGDDLDGCGIAAPDDADLRIVVIDDAVRPIEGATVTLLTDNRTARTNDAGAAFFAEVEPGTHVLLASHPLYADAQTVATVAEGDDEPPFVKIQLTRVIFAEPYSRQLVFDGFLVCSVGFSVYASEECGEGAGVPCEVPVLGCQRVGGQSNNYAQWDFFLDGPWIAQLVTEMQWESTNPQLHEFYFILATEWTCDPFCIGNELNLTQGGTPLRHSTHFEDGVTNNRFGDPLNVTGETRYSTFVWPNWGCNGLALPAIPPDPDCLQQLNVAINQPYDVIATAFYYVPGPDDFSALRGDALPD